MIKINQSPIVKKIQLNNEEPQAKELSKQTSNNMTSLPHVSAASCGVTFGEMSWDHGAYSLATDYIVKYGFSSVDNILETAKKYTLQEAKKIADQYNGMASRGIRGIIDYINVPPSVDGRHVIPGRSTKPGDLFSKLLAERNAMPFDYAAPTHYHNGANSVKLVTFSEDAPLIPEIYLKNTSGLKEYLEKHVSDDYRKNLFEYKNTIYTAIPNKDSNGIKDISVQELGSMLPKHDRIKELEDNLRSAHSRPAGRIW